MKIKKVIAGSLALLAAGVTIGALGAAQSTSLGDYVTANAAADGLSSPMIVVGGSITSPVSGSDVIGAADIAAAMAGYATTPVTVSTGGDVSVSGGEVLHTSGTKFYYGDTMGKTGTKNTLTKNDLPTMLSAGTVVPDSGSTVAFEQYINVGPSGTVTFSKSNGDLNDPVVHISTGSTSTSPMYNTTIVFNKLLNISNTNVQGNTIDLFGGVYTIGADSDYFSAIKKLVLFGGSNVQILTSGTDVTVTVNSVDYTVKLLGVSSSTTAVLQVGTTTQSVTKGNSYTIAGLDVYIDDVFFYGAFEGANNQAKVSFGSSKLILENGNAVKVGTDEDTIDGTLVTLAGTPSSGISKLTVAVTAESDSSDYILPGSGNAFTDPVWKTVKVAFNGLLDGDTETVIIDNSGTTGATVKFTDFRNNEKSLTWAKTGSGTFAPTLNATTTQKYVVIENQTVFKNEWFLFTPNQESEFSHIFQLSTVSSMGSSGAYIELKDKMTGDTTRIALTDQSNGGACTNPGYIDGQPIYAYNMSATSAGGFRFTWGDNSACAVPGDKTTVFPLIKTSEGGWVTLTWNVTVANDTIYELPTNTSFNVTDVSGAVSTPQYGRVEYWVNAAGTVLTLANGAGAGFDYPTVLFLEEKGENTAGTDVQDAVLATVADDSGSGVDLKVVQPTLTAATKSSWESSESDTSVSTMVDRYGTSVEYDSDNQGIATITYFDDQATAGIAIGSDPVFGTTTGGQTVEAAIKIMNPVAKFASEVSTGSLSSDLILVGGPCANALVATLMNASADTCVDDFTGYNGGITTGIIKEFTGAFGSGQKALVVAGMNAADTRSLAAMVMQGTLSYQA